MHGLLFSSHSLGDALRSHGANAVSLKALALAAVLTAVFAVCECVGGYLSQSLALMGDAGHMATDTLSLTFALVANWLSRKGADDDHSYGHARIEVLAAFVNAIFLAQIVLFILYEAFQRFSHAPAINAPMVVVVAGLGLLLNAGVALSLSRGDQNMNTRAAFAHVLGDLLGSVAAIASGAIVYLGGPLWVDPLLSVAIAVILARSVWVILRDTVQVLLDGVPSGVSYDEVGRAIAGVEGVLEVHDLHVWVMTPGYNAVSAHVRIDEISHWPRILAELRAILRSGFDIEHVALQPEWETKGQ